MEWKRRLLVEYADLKEKTNKLDDYLANNFVEEHDVENPFYRDFNIMTEQLEAMTLYLECLEKRILLLMGE